MIDLQTRKQRRDFIDACIFAALIVILHAVFSVLYGPVGMIGAGVGSIVTGGWLSLLLRSEDWIERGAP